MVGTQSAVGSFFSALVFRALAAAVISAIVAGGVVYFVVDQSLRGMETALTQVGGRIEDSNARIFRVEASLDRIETALARQSASVASLRGDMQGLKRAVTSLAGRMDEVIDASNLLDRRTVEQILAQAEQNQAVYSILLENLEADARADMVARVRQQDQFVGHLRGLLANWAGGITYEKLNNFQ